MTFYNTLAIANLSVSKLSASLNKPKLDKETCRINQVTLDTLNKEMQVVMSKNEPKICTIEVKVSNCLENSYQNLVTHDLEEDKSFCNKADDDEIFTALNETLNEQTLIEKVELLLQGYLEDE